MRMTEDPSTHDVDHDNTVPAYEQLALFSSFISEKSSDSVTLDHYDAFASFPMQKHRESEKFESFIRTISIGGKSYSVRITQASIDKTSTKTVGVFPGPRDEIVERTLRYMAVQESLETRLVEDNTRQTHMSIIFSLSSLRKTLKKLGHDFSLPQIRESLTILHGSFLSVTAEDDDSFKGVSSPIFSNLTFDYKKSDKEGSRSFVALCFHPLAKRSIETMAYSPVDFPRLMSLQSPLARWLAARMSNRFRGVSRSELIELKGYHISLDTITNESGVSPEKLMKNRLATVRRALQELANTYLNPTEPYTEQLKHGPSKRGKPPVIGAVWNLNPNAKFITEIIDGNAEMKARRERFGIQKAKI